MTHITELLKQALEALESVLCDPDGNVCWHGSYADRDIIGDALAVFRTASTEYLAQPVQEPFGYLDIEDIESQREYPHNCRNVNLWHEGGEGMVAIYTTPPAAQPAPVPDFKAFKEWADNDGYDVAYTHDGIKWVCLNPMTADLWRAWQAAHGITKGGAA